MARPSAEDKKAWAVRYLGNNLKKLLQGEQNVRKEWFVGDFPSEDADDVVFFTDDIDIALNADSCKDIQYHNHAENFDWIEVADLMFMAETGTSVAVGLSTQYGTRSKFGLIYNMVYVPKEPIFEYTNKNKILRELEINGSCIVRRPIRISETENLITKNFGWELDPCCNLDHNIQIYGSDILYNNKNEHCERGFHLVKDKKKANRLRKERARKIDKQNKNKEKIEKALNQYNRNFDRIIEIRNIMKKGLNDCDIWGFNKDVLSARAFPAICHSIYMMGRMHFVASYNIDYLKIIDVLETFDIDETHFRNKCFKYSISSIQFLLFIKAFTQNWKHVSTFKILDTYKFLEKINELIREIYERHNKKDGSHGYYHINIFKRLHIQWENFYLSTIWTTEASEEIKPDQKLFYKDEYVKENSDN